MISEEVEFLIAQYADGTLSPQSRPQVDAILAADSAARAMLEQYRRLNVVLGAAPAIPNIQWDGLAERISAGVARRPAPAHSYRLPTWAWGTGVGALAASLLIAVGLGWRLARPSSPVTQAPSAVAMSQVVGPSIESSAGPSVAEVAIDPNPPALAAQSRFTYAQDLVVPKPQVEIASAIAVGNPFNAR